MRRSHQIAQDSCGWRLLLQTPVSIHTQTHSFIVRQAETQTVTRRHAGRWLLPHTARPARDTAVQASGSGTNKQAPGPGRLSFLFQNQCKHTEEANSAGRPSWQAGANLKPHTSLAFHTTNKLIDQQAGRIIHHTNSNPQRRPTVAAVAAADACFLENELASITCR